MSDETTASETVVENGIDDAQSDVHGPPPLQHDQEWANALTHAIATAGSLVVGSYLVMLAAAQSVGLAIACGVYVASVLLTFSFSTLSHVVLRQPALNSLRAWDQAMIYAMISGTYTPIVYQYATDAVRIPLLTAIWVAAVVGITTKLVIRHRINSIGAISYLLLGWLPAIPLAGHIPSVLAWSMLAGGVMYTVGVVLLMNDSKVRYMHAAWHICVITAASCHYLGILLYVVRA